MERRKREKRLMEIESHKHKITGKADMLGRVANRFCMCN